RCYRDWSSDVCSSDLERDVQAAKLLDRFPDELLDFGASRYVGLDEQAIAARGADQINRFLSFGFAAAGDHHFGPGLRKKHGGVTANTGRPAGHNPHFALQFRRHDFFPQLKLRNGEAECRPSAKLSSNRRPCLAKGYGSGASLPGFVGGEE